jgi:peptidoglycan/LPS O-acetylase OafA/YrhL
MHHVAGSLHLSGFVNIAFRFGQEAVLVFFLLSGFVIFSSESNRISPKSCYFWRRADRLIPPFIAALLVSTIVSLLNGNFLEKFSVVELIGTILSLQDISTLKPGVFVDPYMGNDPLWSLSYEIFFYAIFPVVLRLWNSNNKKWNNIIGFICCMSYLMFAVFPNHFSLVGAYFLVWWTGAMAANAYLRGANDLRGFVQPYGWLLTLSAIAAGVVFVVGYRGVGYYPVLPLRHFAVGALFLAIFASPVGRWLAGAFTRVGPAASWIASISYGMYVLHYPLLVQWTLARTLPGFLLALVILVVLSYLVDRRLAIVIKNARRRSSSVRSAIA